MDWIWKVFFFGVLCILFPALLAIVIVGILLVIMGGSV